MRVLDFDNTIYDGESLFDFYLFSIRYNPRVLKFLFIVLHHVIKYKLGRTTMASLERVIRRYAADYLRSFPNLDSIVKDFWDKNFSKLKPWYTPRKDDVILTASFNVIMDELFRRIGVEHCVCSIFDLERMETVYINFSENKPAKFRELFGERRVDEFYTDSPLDAPMIAVAEKAFLVKGDKISQIK